MISKIVKKVVAIADYVFAWSCLLVGGTLLMISIMGIVLPFVLAFPLLAFAAAYSQRRADESSSMAIAPA